MQSSLIFHLNPILKDLKCRFKEIVDIKMLKIFWILRLKSILLLDGVELLIWLMFLGSVSFLRFIFEIFSKIYDLINLVITGGNLESIRIFEHHVTRSWASCMKYSIESKHLASSIYLYIMINVGRVMTLIIRQLLLPCLSIIFSIYLIQNNISCNLFSIYSCQLENPFINQKKIKFIF